MLLLCVNFTRDLSLTFLHPPPQIFPSFHLFYIKRESRTRLFLPPQCSSFPTSINPDPTATNFPGLSTISPYSTSLSDSPSAFSFLFSGFVPFLPDFHGILAENDVKGMTKSMDFFQTLIKPFKRGSHRGAAEDDIERIAALEQKVFPFQVLVSATKDFHPNHKLGEGGFGPVYKGRLPDGREIAVKKLSHASRQGKNEFVNEAKLLAKVQHRNVVNLLGYCTHGEDKLLVYEYVSNESLDKVLFKSNRRAELDWRQRLEIITGVARGLLYLHEDAPNCIIHRDIKAGNILLDDKWVPKIADFGMARLFPEDRTHVNTRVAGTNGYMAPEYVMHGVLSVKADVFSFGVLVLELICGQKNSSFALRHADQTLLEWAYRLYKKGRTMEIVDPAIAASVDPDQVKLSVQIGLLCTQGDPLQRPSMRRVALLLSRKPGHLEEPTRPGVPGSRYRRSQHDTAGTSSVGTTSTTQSSSESFGSNLNTNTGSGRGTATASATPTWSPATQNTSSDSRGKRRLWSY